MKKLYAVLSVLFLFLFVPLPVSAAEEILDYKQLVSIQKNSDLRIKESIKINVENVNVTHGIIRKIPVVRTDAQRRRRPVGFALDGVLLDGEKVPCSIERAGSECLIRIGSADAVIPRGIHVFTLFYTVRGEIGFFEDHDELYWNVTGNEWDFPICRASCAVQLPETAFGKGFTAIEWYVGSFGEKGSKSDALLTAENAVQTLRTLHPGEGLTIAFGWKKGIVDQPPLPKLDDPKTHSVIGMLVFLAVFSWLFYAWNRWGRDPVKPVIPLFHAPEGISPAALAYAEKLEFDDRTLLSSDIVDLAVKGALTIERTGGERKLIFKTPVSYTLHKTDTLPENLTEDERQLHSRLFDNCDAVDLSCEQYETLNSAKISVKTACRQQLGRLYENNTAPFSVAALFYVLGVALLYFRSNELFPLDMFACGIGGVIMFLTAMQRGKKPGQLNFGTFFRRILLQIIFVGIGALIVVSLGNNPFPFVVFGASCAAVSVFRPLMQARNERGAELYVAAEGLKMYMTAAEKDRLE
ncbi:MAG: DUF2207 domain-containing protein, partial [Synergistaceae bacterium]|nr:DUF2207 domain-containing protein [Synergistaceae bacterium]